MCSLFQLLKAGCSQSVFTFLSLFREQRSINFLGPCGSKTTPILRTRGHMGARWLCETARGPQPLPSDHGLQLSPFQTPAWFRPQLPSHLHISHQMPLIAALNGSALNNSH